jgi:hypothetical protein
MKKPHGFNYHAAFFMMDFYVLYYFMSVPHWCQARGCGQKVGLNTLRKEIEDVFRGTISQSPGGL